MNNFTTIKLYHTTDYSRFQKRKDNRDLNFRHVKEIKLSLEKCNDLALNPIKVNSDMEVIDGQHRLQAAKELGIPVYYIIDENFYPEKIQLYNTAVKEWDKSAFLQRYVASGNESYQKLKQFMNEFLLPLGLALVWTGQGSVPRKNFDDGTYVFRFSQEMRNALLYTKSFTEALIEQKILKKIHVDCQTFHRASRQQSSKKSWT